jgi:hypothetical protein
MYIESIAERAFQKSFKIKIPDFKTGTFKRMG